MSHSPDSDNGAAPQFHEPAPSPMAAAAAAPVTATGSAAASGASASSAALPEPDRPVVRVHGLEQAEQESGAPAASSSTHMAADSSAAPVMPAPSPAAATAAATGSSAFGRSDEGTLGPAPGPSIVAESNAAVQAPMLSTATAPIDVAAVAAASASSASASTPASQPNGLYSASSNGSASSSSSSSSAISTSSNPSAPALAAALWPLVAQVRANTDASVVPPLDSVLAVIQSLPFEARSNLCRAATVTPASSSAAAASPSSAVFDATLAYFLDDSHSGSAQDGLCKFLYELYWEASTKLGHDPVLPAAERNNNLVAPSAASTPPAHLFLLNFLPLLIYKFVQKHFDASSATATAASGSSSSSSYAGLFTVFLAVYNTERILAARSGNGGILAPKPVPTAATLPELEGVVPFAAPVIAVAPGVVKPVSAQPPSLQQQPIAVLPAINEPTTVHVMLLLHVLLLKHHAVFPQLLPQSRESLVFLAGLATTSGLLGSADPFADVARIATQAHQHALHHHKHHSAAATATTAPVQTLQPQQPQPASVASPVKWNHAWVSASPLGSSVTPVRYLLTSSLLQDFLLGIEFVLNQSRASDSAGPSFRDWVLIALRQVHCRALEEMMPEILLQTTCMLQQEEEDRQRH